MIARPVDFAARQRAWQCFDRNLSVVAGAGTGKTRVLVDRYTAWILAEGWRRTEDPTPSRVVGGILAITFTEKAAGEMQERIASTLELIADPDAHTGHKDAAYVRDFGAQLSAWFDIAPPLLRARAQAALAQAHRMSVSTIHAFAARLLRLFPIEAEIHPDFEVDATLSERRRIVRRVLVDVVRGALTSDTPEGMARVVSELGQARLETLILRALDVTTPLTELAAPPDFRAILDDAGRLRAACLRVVHQVPPASAEKLRRTARGLETLQKTLTQDGVPESAREIMVQLEADLSKEFAAKVMERLTTERSAVEQARTALHPVVRELLRLDLAFVREVGRQITPAVEAARTRLNARGLLSFDDLLRVAEKLLVSQSKVATWVADQYPQILVDEFQDTDRRQCAMLSAIDDARPDQGRLFVVGDPKQSIYAFRGADLAAYTDFVDRLDEPLTLMTSFRSEGRLVRTVNAAFDTLFVPRRGVQPAPGPLSPFRGDSEVSAPTEVWSLDPPPGSDKRTVDAARDIEAAAITRRLLALDAARPSSAAGRRWSRYAVLSRVQSEAARLVEVLEEAGIPCAVTGDKEFYRRQEVVDAANLLRVIVDPADAEAWVGLLRCPIGGVPDRALLPLAAGGFFLGRDLQAALLKARRSVESESELAAHIDRVMLLEREIEALRTHFYDGPIDLWLPELERRLPIPDVYAAEWLGERKVTNFQRVLSEFVQVATAGVPPLGEWLDDVASRLVGRDDEAESALADDTTDAVRIMSIHASKGLEFDVVFVPRLDWTASGGAGEEVALAETPDGLVVELRGRRRQMTSWGTAALKSARKEVEDAEVVRLFYVACTRAREQLILCGLTGKGALATHTAVGFADGVMHKAGLAVVARGSAEALHTEIDPSARSAAPVDVEPLIGPVLAAESALLALRSRVVSQRRVRTATADTHLDAPDGEAAAPTAVVSDEPQGDLFGGLLAPAASTLGGTDFGTEVHALLEQWDGRSDGRSLDLRNASPEAARLVRGFLASPLAARVRQARRVFREIPYVLGDERGAEVGAIDLLLDTEAGWIVVDYKTNRVPSVARAKVVAQSYQSQAEAYRRAVADALGIEGVSVELWFLRGPWAVPV